jgi:predicted ATPase/DNA-binding SARP family transcriptional activator
MLAESDAQRETSLEIRLFGPFHMSVKGQTVSGLPIRVQQLIAMLALAGNRGLNRAATAETLWPDTAPERMLFYLRRALSTLRNSLGEERERLIAEGDGIVRLDLAGCTCDALEFDALLQRADVASLETAAELYRGAFLAGDNSEWASAEREHRRNRFVSLFERLAAESEVAEDLSRAAWFLSTALTIDPSREHALRKLLKVMAAQGDFAGVARRYRDWQVRMKKEFGLPLSKETVDLYKSLLGDAKLLAGTLPEFSPRHPVTSRRPTPSTALIGREQELRELATELDRRRLVTIVGTAGVGKTRIALAAMEEMASRQNVEVAYVDMAAGDTSAPLLHRLATALDQPVDEPDLVHRVEDWFRSSPTLVLIDHAEAAVKVCAEFVARTLSELSGARFLIASRVPLGVESERILPVAPLRVPGRELASLEQVRGCSAVEMLLNRVEAAAPHLHIDDDIVPTIVRICRKLEGLPLALELVAARFRTMSASEIANRLDEGILQLGPKPGASPRHQSLESAIRWSFELLSNEEKQLFGRLAVFPDTWSLEAAEQICHLEDLPKARIAGLLSALVDQSLVEFLPKLASGRYRMLEPIRFFANELMQGSAELASALQLAHAHYYLKLASQSTIVDSDLEEANFVAAVTRSVDRGDEEGVTLSLHIVNRLFADWYRFGTLSSALKLIERVIEAARPYPSEALVEALFRAGVAAMIVVRTDLADSLLDQAERMGEEIGAHTLSTQSRHRRGDLAANQGRLEDAKRLLGAALESYRADEDERGEAACLGTLGYVARVESDFFRSLEITELALVLFTKLNDMDGRLWCLGSLAATFTELGENQRAEASLLEVLEGQRAMGNLPAQAWNLTMLGDVTCRLGRYDDAEAYLKQALEIQEKENGGILRVWPLNVLSTARLLAGNSAGAREALEEALVLCRQAPPAALEFDTLIRLVDLHLDLNDWPSASAYLDLARECAAKLDVSRMQPKIATRAERLSNRPAANRL